MGCGIPRSKAGEPTVQENKSLDSELRSGVIQWGRKAGKEVRGAKGSLHCGGRGLVVGMVWITFLRHQGDSPAGRQLAFHAVHPLAPQVVP